MTESCATGNTERWAIFVLAYNEEGTLEIVLERATKALTAITSDWELLVIYDASRDRTAEIADRWATWDSRVRVIHNPKNQGISQNLLLGYREARGEIVGMICSDMQFDPAELVELAKEMSDADVLNTFRLNRNDPLKRKFITGTERFLNRLFFGLPFRDYHWIKLYRSWIFKSITIEAQSQFLETELLVKAKALGARIKEPPTHHFPRTKGQAGGGNWKMVVNAVLDVLRFRIKLWCHPVKVSDRSREPQSPG